MRSGGRHGLAGHRRRWIELNCLPVGLGWRVDSLLYQQGLAPTGHRGNPCPATGSAGRAYPVSGVRVPPPLSRLSSFIKAASAVACKIGTELPPRPACRTLTTSSILDSSTTILGSVGSRSRASASSANHPDPQPAAGGLAVLGHPPVYVSCLSFACWFRRPNHLVNSQRVSRVRSSAPNPGRSLGFRPQRCLADLQLGRSDCRRSDHEERSTEAMTGTHRGCGPT